MGPISSTAPAMRTFLLTALLSLSTSALSCHADTLDQLAATISDTLSAADPHPFRGTVLIEVAGQTRRFALDSTATSPYQPQADSAYIIGSLSKQITATLVLREVAAGRLQLDDTLAEALPSLNAPWAKQVRVRHLLNHSAGIEAADQPLKTVPGSTFAYSNWGYELLGQIVSRSAGQPYEKLAGALFRQCGMAHSSLPDSGTIADLQAARPGLLAGEFEGPDGQLRPSTRLYLQQEVPAGGIVSTVSDLAAWNRCLHGGPALPAAQYHAMTMASMQRQSHRWGELGYGFGLQVSQREHLLEYSHNGYLGGYMTTLLAYPEQHTSVVILENIAWRSDDLSRAFALQDRVRELVRKHLQQAGQP